MKNIDSIKISKFTTVKTAMKILDKTSLQILLVVDEYNILLGTITDGDIRRALLQNKPIETVVTSIMNCQPIIGKIEDNDEIYIEKLLKIKRKQLPIVDENNQLVEVVFLEELLLKKKNETNVILMAGGLGTRLRPLTNEIPKPMLKVGKYPILETIIRRFKSQGFINFTLSVNYKKEIIQNYFQDGRSFDVNIDYLIENKKLGTAGALSLIEKEIESPIVVMNGDILTSLDFNKLLLEHNKSDAVATICVRKFEYQVPYGVVIAEDGCLKKIDEKPSYEYLTNAGIYILNPEIIQKIPRNMFFDMPELLNTLIEDRLKINVCTVEDYWIDIGQINDYKKASLELGSEEID